MVLRISGDYKCVSKAEFIINLETRGFQYKLTAYCVAWASKVAGGVSFYKVDKV